MENTVVAWLLEGDPAIRWQTMRDLTGASESAFERERRKTLTEGWGKRLLAKRQKTGLWANGLYNPKWISTTYTLLLLRILGLATGDPRIEQSCRILLDEGLYQDGGINLHFGNRPSETCVTGMVLAIASHFHIDDDRLETIVKYLQEEQMSDGGWNCRKFRGATHSSVHTTISVLEGLGDYEKLRRPCSPLARKLRLDAAEFLLRHKLFRSHKTGRIFDPRLTRFSFPPQWHYDILRGLDHFQECKLKPDSRMDEAIELVVKKRTEKGFWLLPSGWSGRKYFDMEKAGKPSRWNTLRALRVLKWYSAETL